MWLIILCVVLLIIALTICSIKYRISDLKQFDTIHIEKFIPERFSFLVHEITTDDGYIL
jgi:hypothetical protein